MDKNFRIWTKDIKLQIQETTYSKQATKDKENHMEAYHNRTPENQREIPKQAKGGKCTSYSRKKIVRPV